MAGPAGAAHAGRVRDAYVGYWIWACGDRAPGEEEVRAMLRGVVAEQAEARGRGPLFRDWLDRLEVRVEHRAGDPSAFDFLDDPVELVRTGEAGGVTAGAVARFRAAGWGFQVKYAGERPAGHAHLWPLHQATSGLARALDGLVTRVLDDRAWVADRFDLELAWRDRPRLTSLVTIHGWWLDRDAGLLELHTHGMESFGLDDLVLAEIAADHADAGAAILNQVAAELAAERAAAVELRRGVAVDCMPDTALTEVLVGEGDLAAWSPARAPGEVTDRPALLLQEDMAERVARTRPTLPRLEAWCGAGAFAHDERVELWAHDGAAWSWLELAGTGPAAWRGLVATEAGERAVPVDPARIARWQIRRAGRITDGSWISP